MGILHVPKLYRMSYLLQSDYQLQGFKYCSVFKNKNYDGDEH